MGDYRKPKFMPPARIGKMPCGYRDITIGVNELIHRVTTGQAGFQEVQDSCFAVTALNISVRRRQVQPIEMLLERGVDINAIDDFYGETPLHAALIVKATELVPLLLKHGADVTIKSIFGQNVFHYLAYTQPSEKTTEVARTLIQMAGVLLHERNYHGDEPIHTVLSLKQKDLVKLYVEYGVNVNALREDGESPLTLAARNGFDNTSLKILLERGANVHLKATRSGCTALHRACKSYNKESIELLLSAGADVLAEDHNGRTPFSLITYLYKEQLVVDSAMIKALALKKCCLPSIELKDERIMQKNPKVWDYYRDCHAHLSRMKITKFSKTCTFLDLLTKNRCKIAVLMRDPGFEANFQLYDLTGFSMYAEDILGAFERARNYYHAMLEQEDVINEAVYYMLPDIVVREVVRHIFDCCKNVKCEKRFC